MLKELCYVVDSNNNPLSPTSFNKGFVLIRKNKASMISRLPFVIKLNKVIEDINSNEVTLGLDTGSKWTGIALVEKCKTKNKVLFKGTINHPQDVKKKMELRRGYRKYRRSHKRYRKARFDNRASSKKKGRLPNSIKCNKDEILRTIYKLQRFIIIDKVIIEDVMIDIRKLTDGYKYKWQYQKSNRLDSNLRIATIMRDNNTCKMCGKTNTKIEVHHIKARKHGGSDSIHNLICLCADCHFTVTGKEEHYEELLYSKIKGKHIDTKHSQRAMQGKTYLREFISSMYELELTYGSDTANKRLDWNIEKSHSNDAICITDLEVRASDCDIKDWHIKPLRSNKKSKVDEVLGFRHRDIIKYTRRDGSFEIGYIIALDKNKKTCSFANLEGKEFRRYGLGRCKVIQRDKGISFI